MKKDYLSAYQNISKESLPRFDFHLHTTWTDGADSVEAMYKAAQKNRLEAILFSEHARKTSGDWFGEFASEVRSMAKSDCVPLVGVETKVEDLDGTLDSTDEILAEADLVMASVHRFPGEKGEVRGFGDVRPEEAEELEFNLAKAILKNPRVDILAHPFGMCYRRYHVTPSPEKIRELIALTAKTKIAFEINCHYHPDPWLLVRWCQERGARISLGSNAHEVKDVGRILRVLEGTEAACAA